MGNLGRERVKVTVDLQGCLPKNHSHARLLCYNHRKVYHPVKLLKFSMKRNIFFGFDNKSVTTKVCEAFSMFQLVAEKIYFEVGEFNVCGSS